MTIPEHVIKTLYSHGDYQENIDFDGNGNEIYHGVAPNNALITDDQWVIAKGVYSNVTIGGASIWIMSHVSFLRGQIWANRTSISFP
jgi:hypothetical protein